MKDYKEFTEFLMDKRLEKQISLRGLAKQLGITSATYVSDVEKGRRKPFEIAKLQMLKEILELTDTEYNLMLDLAGKARDGIAPDLPEYIKNTEYVSAALRTAKDLEASEEQWKRFIEDLKKER